MRNQIRKYLKSVLSLVVFIVFAASCEIGLGEEVDQSAPIISISAPAILASVPQSFEVSGTAKDNYGVVRITVEISETGQKYQYNGSEWQVYTGDSWKKYENGKISGSPSDLSWSVVVNVTGAKSAQDYTLVCQVYDAMGNEGKSTKDERCITMDIVEPTVSIIEPVLTSTFVVAKANKDTYTTKDNNVLSYLLNGDFTISGSQKEDTSLDSLFVYLDEGTTENILSYEKENDITKVINPIVSRKITGESLRNWETSVKLSELPASYISGKHLIRLITESHDKAGNVERKVQGWFIYYNEADIPWIEAKFGDNTDIPNTDAESGPVQTKVFPNCTLQGQVYDDDGIAEVKIVRTVYDAVNGVWLEDSAKDFPQDLAKDGYPKYYAWSVNAISENKRFKIEITCKDIKGNVGEKVVRYMGITDTTPPTITIESPLNGSTVISKTLTINGKVVDDGGIKSLKMVRLQNANKNDMMDYFSGDEGWNVAAPKNGNKVFEIPLTGSDIPVGGYVTKTFNKTFDIFDDFGISADEVINTQNFVFKAVDNNDSSSVEAFTLQGDTEAPKLTIEKVTVVSKTGSSVDYDLTTDDIQTLNPFNKENGGITDRITVSGKWNDNSYNEWKDSAKIGKIKVNIYSNNYDIIPSGSGTGDKEWKIENIVPQDISTVSINASLTDFGGNTTQASSCYYVNSSTPELVSITSLTPNGSYKAGDKIIIVLEYNKKVTFTGTTGAILNLNNGGKAYYDTDSNSNGSAKHQYVYEIASGNTDVATLTVKSIDKNGDDAEWKDPDGAKIASVTTVPAGMNLGDWRSITIDKVVPTIKSITTSTAKATYKAGNEIFTQLEFSEDVYFYDAAGNPVTDSNVNSKLSLSYNISGTTGTATTKLSPKNIVFKYVVDSAENQGDLEITSINFGGLLIKDKAGNVLNQETIAASLYSSVLNGIKIDTKTPSTPIITVKEGDNTITTGAIVYSSSGVVITVDWGDNAGSIKKYSIDSGASWAEWPTANKVVLDRNKEYKIQAKQENAAGTESAIQSPVLITLDSGAMLTSVISSVPDGIYKAGKEIDISLKFRKAVTIDTVAKLKLNIKNSSEYKYATYYSGDGTKNITYKYTIATGDIIEDTDGLLKVLAFSPSFVHDEKENSVIDYTNLPTTSGARLQDSRKIKINTSTPAVTSVDFKEKSSGTEKVTYLEIKFDMPISRGTGNIVITQDEDSYIPPAVLSSAEYTKFRDVGNAIDTFYKEGTNGADYNSTYGFTADLTKKYILNYDETPKNYANANDNVKNIIDVLKEKGALTKSISIKSNSVTITGDTITVELINQNKLPVKGASYTIDIPDGLVLNELGVSNACGIDGKTKVTYTNTLKGVEKPVIRVKKTAEYWGDTVLNTEPTQPLTASVKIDCQSPNANVYYVKSEKTSTTKAVDRTVLPVNGAGNKLQKDTASEHTTVPTLTISDINKYSAEFTIGSLTDKEKGYKVCIHAQAVDKTNTSIKSEDSYEVANRTVILFYDSETPSGHNYRWIRGGDWTSGGVGTPGFPFSWNKDEYSKVRAMTSLGKTETVTAPDSGNNNKQCTKKGFYWVSWNISTTAYVGFLAGDMPSTANTSGPNKWWWTSNAWVALKEYYPIYPGQSVRFDSLFNNDNFSQCLGSSRGLLAYQDKHKEQK